MKIKILLATMLLGLTGTAQVSADTLLIDEVTRNSADQADRPGGGLSMNDVEEKFGEHEGKIFINHEKIKYTIPILIHYTEASIFVNQENNSVVSRKGETFKSPYDKVIQT